MNEEAWQEAERLKEERLKKKYQWDPSYEDVFTWRWYYQRARARGISSMPYEVNKRRRYLREGVGHVCVEGAFRVVKISTCSTCACGRRLPLELAAKNAPAWDAIIKTNSITSSGYTSSSGYTIATTGNYQVQVTTQTSPSESTNQRSTMTLSFKNTIGKTVHFVQSVTVEQAATIVGIVYDDTDGQPGYERLDTVNLLTIGDGVHTSSTNKQNVEHSEDGHVATWHYIEECLIEDADETPAKK